MVEVKRSDKLMRVKRKLPPEYQGHYVYSLDPHLVEILRDPDPGFVDRVKGYLVRHMRKDAQAFGYDKWVIIPRFGRPEILLAGGI